jgi:hypothetical protein
MVWPKSILHSAFRPHPTPSRTNHEEFHLMCAFYDPEQHKLSFGVRASRNTSGRADEAEAAAAFSQVGPVQPIVEWVDAADGDWRPCQHLVVGVGAAGAAFLRCIAPGSAAPLVGRVRLESYKEGKDSEGNVCGPAEILRGCGEGAEEILMGVPSPSAELRQCPQSGTVVCILPDDRIPAWVAPSWALTLLEDDRLKNVTRATILASIGATEYKGRGQAAQLRVLRTDNTLDLSKESVIANNVPPLQPPNVVAGVTAALLARCQLRGTPATAFCALQPLGAHCRVDIDVVAAFTGALPALGMEMEDPGTFVLQPTEEDMRRAIAEDVTKRATRHDVGHLYL